MTGLLAAEWIKLRTRWMPRVIILLLMLQSLSFVGRRSTGPGHHATYPLPQGWVVALLFAGFIGPYFWPVLGGSWAGGEYAWGTIGLILSRRPYRAQFVVAALLMLLLCAAIGLIALLVTFGAACLVAALFTGGQAFDTSALSLAFLSVLGTSFLATLYVIIFYLVLSYSAGTIFRSSAIGIAIGIGSSLAQIILSGILMRLGGIWAVLAAHFPFQFGQALVVRVASSALAPGEIPAATDPGTPAVGESLLFLSIYLAVLLAITFLTVRARDMTS
jgi:ABC-type transport system involved in multi-copper enzyme maturation permease subunit